MSEQERIPNIEDLYNAKNNNFPWEGFKYVISPHYHHTNPNIIPPPPKPSPKLNYVDHLLRIKKTIPAPNAYHPDDHPRPISGKMNRKPRKTMTDQTIATTKKQQYPGPGAYATRPQTADNKINRNAPEYRQHYLHQVQYLSSECPGVGQYNVTKPKHISTPKYAKPYFKTESTKRLKTEKSAKDLTKTLVEGTFEWMAAQKKTTNKNYFGKSRRFQGANKQEKKPGPTSYKLNNKWSDSTSVLKTTSSFSNFKNVYYGS